MVTVLKNRTLQVLASANLFATLGVSIFNIILLTYAKSFAQPYWFVSIVSVATVMPYVTGAVTGRLADQTRCKNNWLIGSKLIQAGLYLVLAKIINQHTVIIFVVIILINLVSDIIGRYGGNLLTIVIQNRVSATERQQTLGFNQSVSTIVEPLGQTLGVLIIAQSHNYALAGIINALAFLCSAGCLFIGRQSITTNELAVPQSASKGVWSVIQRLMTTTTGMGAVSYLGILMILNVATMSLDAVLNLIFIDLAPHLHLSYATAILLVNIVFVVGSVLGGITKNTWFDHISLFQLLLLAISAPGFTYGVLIWVPRLAPILIGMFMVAFLSGKLDPKMFAIFMTQVDSHQTGAVFGTVSSIVTVAAPMGSVGIVLLYNLVGTTAACQLALGLVVSALIWALVAHRH